MAVYTVLNVDRNGVRYDNALVAVAASDTFANDGRTFLLVSNQNAATLNVTFDLSSDPMTAIDTHTSTATNLPLLTTEQHLFGPFDVGRYGSIVTVNFDLLPSVTAMAFRLVAA